MNQSALHPRISSADGYYQYRPADLQDGDKRKGLVMSIRDGMRASARPVARDNERFRLLASTGRPLLPEGYSAPLTLKTTREIIGERLRAAGLGYYWRRT